MRFQLLVLCMFGQSVTLAATIHQGESLLKAAESGDHNRVEQLIKEGVNVNYTDNKGDNALHRAIKKDHQHIVELLITNGIFIDHKNDKGLTPLIWSVMRQEDTGTARALLKAGADPNIQQHSKERDSNRTALHYAALTNNRQDFAKLLIEFGADIDIRDNYGNTALHITAEKDRTEFASILLDAGANKSLLNRDRLTAYENALYNDKWNVATVIKAACRVVLAVREALERLDAAIQFLEMSNLKESKNHLQSAQDMKAFLDKLHQQHQKEEHSDCAWPTTESLCGTIPTTTAVSVSTKTPITTSTTTPTTTTKTTARTVTTTTTSTTTTSTHLPVTKLENNTLSDTCYIPCSSLELQNECEDITKQNKNMKIPNNKKCKKWCKRCRKCKTCKPKPPKVPPFSKEVTTQKLIEVTIPNPTQPPPFIIGSPQNHELTVNMTEGCLSVEVGNRIRGGEKAKLSLDMLVAGHTGLLYNAGSATAGSKAYMTKGLHLLTWNHRISDRTHGLEVLVDGRRVKFVKPEKKMWHTSYDFGQIRILKTGPITLDHCVFSEKDIQEF